ncbi:response regulator [Luteibacter jiangsuensis]
MRASTALKYSLRLPIFERMDMGGAELIDLKGSLDGLGWLANAIGIGTPLLGGVTIYIRYIHPRIKPSRATSLIRPEARNSWNVAKAKQLARIAIVDDEPGDFPTADLKADGYSVDEFTQVSLANHATLSTYDIVFLDMKGIIRDDPDRGGLKLIAELRRRNSKQKICAVSGQTFDPTATEFFRKADDYKKKPLTAQECKLVIDRFLEESLDIRLLVVEADRLLLSIPRAKRRGMLNALRSFANGSASADDTRNTVRESGISSDDSETFIKLGRVLHHASRRVG